MPRAGLTRAVVVAAGAQLADEIGLERLTLAAVAQRVGVKLPSLYKHVRGIDDLVREIAGLALDELHAQLTAATVGRSRREALAGLAHTYRQYASRHPGRYATTLRAPDPDDAAYTARAQRVVDVVFSALAGYGFEGDDAVDAVRILRSALHGFVALETAGGFGLPRDIDGTFGRLIDTLDRSMAMAPDRTGGTGGGASAVPARQA